jgi:hypothetical protein
MFESDFCKNCDAPLKEEYKHCPECGQKVDDDLNIRVLFNNTISNYFSIDARFFKSFLPLMFRPGFLARKFVEGKRLQYLHPAQYYLFVSVVFFFILSFNVRDYNAAADKMIKKGFELEKSQDSINVNPIDSTAVADIINPVLDNPNLVTGINEEERKLIDSVLTKELADPKKNNINFGYNTRALDSLIAVGATEDEMIKSIGISDNPNMLQRAFARQLIKFHKQEGGGIVQAFFDTIPIALFFLLPIFAFILKLFYWRKGRFSYHLVFSFYYFSFLFIILGFLIGVNRFLWDIPGWLSGLAIFYTFIYLWLSMRYFYKQGYFLTFFKSGMAAFVYMMFIVPVALGIIAAASFFFY